MTDSEYFDWLESQFDDDQDNEAPLGGVPTNFVGIPQYVKDWELPDDPCWDHDRNYICTEPKGHIGPHVARIRGSLSHFWVVGGEATKTPWEKSRDELAKMLKDLEKPEDKS